MAPVLRSVLLPLVLAGPLCGVSGCAVDGSTRPEDGPTPAESAEDFARRAFDVMDAATTCVGLEKAWDAYLDPATRAAVRRLVPCNSKVLAATYPLDSVRDGEGFMYDDTSRDRPDAVADADQVHEVDLDAPERFGEEDSFTYEVFLGSGWLVLTTGSEHTLFNTTFDVLDECLKTEEGCRLAG
jgi:hypothetical protein